MKFKKIGRISVCLLAAVLFVTVAKADVYFDDILNPKSFTFPTQKTVTTEGNIRAIRGTIYGAAEYATTTSTDELNMTFSKKGLFGYDTPDRCFDKYPSGTNVLTCTFRSNISAGYYQSTLILNKQNDNKEIRGVYHLAKK